MVATLEKVRDEGGNIVGFRVVFDNEKERNELFESLNRVENFGRCLVLLIKIHNKHCTKGKTCVPAEIMEVD